MIFQEFQKKNIDQAIYDEKILVTKKIIKDRGYLIAEVEF